MTGTVALLRLGAAVFIGMNPLEEEGIIKGIDGRLIDSLAERESETMQVLFKVDGEDQPLPNGSLCLKNDAFERLLLIAEALATSVASLMTNGALSGVRPCGPDCLKPEAAKAEGARYARSLKSFARLPRC